MQPLLKLSSISRSFGAIHALKTVDFEILPGEVMGPGWRERRWQVDAGQDHQRLR